MVIFLGVFIVVIRLRAKRFGETRRSLGEGGRFIVFFVLSRRLVPFTNGSELWG